MNVNSRVSGAELAAIRSAAEAEERRPSAYARRIVLAALREGGWLSFGTSAAHPEADPAD